LDTDTCSLLPDTSEFSITAISNATATALIKQQLPKPFFFFFCDSTFFAKVFSIWSNVVAAFLNLEPRCFAA
jgi:hypothetical protein